MYCKSIRTFNTRKKYTHFKEIILKYISKSRAFHGRYIFCFFPKKYNFYYCMEKKTMSDGARSHIKNSCTSNR